MTHDPHTKDDLIRRFGLQPHPEGGYFRETYRAPMRVTRESAPDGSTRAASTAIYFLLCDGAVSTWHRIQSDETWHFYAGDALLVHVIHADGDVATHRLGNALTDAAAVFQLTVPAGAWFAAECENGGDFALVGCTVAPGFEFSEFEIADAVRLAETYAEHRTLIGRLARR
jgi:predicted cupin superfamily sugar epimerase